MEINEIVKKLFNERLISVSSVDRYLQTKQVDEAGNEVTLYYDTKRCTEQDIIQNIMQCKCYTTKFINNPKFDYALKLVGIEADIRTLVSIVYMLSNIDMPNVYRSIFLWYEKVCWHREMYIKTSLECIFDDERYLEMIKEIKDESILSKNFTSQRDLKMLNSMVENYERYIEEMKIINTNFNADYQYEKFKSAVEDLNNFLKIAIKKI